MKTLFDLVAGEEIRQQHKHELGERHAINQVNGWSQYEFLERLSEALEILLPARKDGAE